MRPNGMDQLKLIKHVFNKNLFVIFLRTCCCNFISPKKIRKAVRISHSSSHQIKNFHIFSYILFFSSSCNNIDFSFLFLDFFLSSNTHFLLQKRIFMFFYGNYYYDCKYGSKGAKKNRSKTIFCYTVFFSFLSFFF